MRVSVCVALIGVLVGRIFTARDEQTVTAPATGVMELGAESPAGWRN